MASTVPAYSINLEHDYPQRISYERREGELHARIEGGGPAPEWKLTPR